MSDGKKTVNELSIEERNKAEYFLKNNFHKRKVSDGGLTMAEIHNPNSFAVKMIRVTGMINESISVEKYIQISGINLGAPVVLIPPGGFAVLPHQYYHPEGVGLPKGEPIQLVVNYGNMMGVGNRFPSRPE